MPNMAVKAASLGATMGSLAISRIGSPKLDFKIASTSRWMTHFACAGISLAGIGPAQAAAHAHKKNAMLKDVRHICFSFLQAFTTFATRETPKRLMAKRQK